MRRRTSEPWPHGLIGNLLKRSLNSAYFLVLNDREIRHSLILLPAGYALLDGRSKPGCRRHGISSMAWSSFRGESQCLKLLVGLTDYFVFYNTERTHQSRDYRTPDEVYRIASGGGASMADHFGERETCSLGHSNKSGQCRSAACARLPS